MSDELFERATRVLPGGNTRTQLFVPPRPRYAARASGTTLVLDDGREVTDFLLDYTACAVGHAHPHVVEAARAALESGAPFGFPSAVEVSMAEALVERVPALERVRFTNSGSEATMHAIRTARAFTGRFAVAKAEGAYHGSHDLTDFSVTTLGPEPLVPHPQTPGMPPGLADAIVLFPFNDLPGTIEALERSRDRLATVLLEVFLNSAGVIAAADGYLRGVADWCRANGVLVTVDEVASFRTGYHGAHGDHGLTPDLVCLGKAIGGGFAIGAFGGREDVMAILDPRRPDHIRHAGTFNGHPVALAAGLAALDVLDRETITRMNLLGERLVDGIRAVGRARGLELTASGYGSVGNVHLTREPPRTFGEVRRPVPGAMVDLYWALLERGYAIAPRGQLSTCAVTTEAEVDGLLAAFDDAAAATLG